jgi:hypothetical protein
MSDRAGLSSSELHPKGPGGGPARRHHSFGNIDADETPDLAACATLFQKIMSDGIEGKGAQMRSSSFTARKSSFTIEERPERPKHKRGSSFQLPTKQSSFHLPKKQSSFHVRAPESKKPIAEGASFHTDTDTSSITDPSMAAGPAPMPAFPLPTSKAKKSNRPIERRPIEKPPLEDDLPLKEMAFEEPVDKSSTIPTMQVLDLLWHDLRGVQGKYSGQINTHIQPHGFGSLVLADGTTITCKWYNGTPLDRRRSDSGYFQKAERRRSSRRSSEGTSRRSSEGAPHSHHVLDESSRTNGSGTHPHDVDYKKSISEPTKSSKLSKRHTTYELGDTPLSNSHMVVPSSMKKAIESVDSLKMHDFAFVLRSNGEWCYSIVAKKNPPSEVEENGRVVKNFEDANILFVTDTKGSTKCIKMKHWGKMIRLVNL